MKRDTFSCQDRYTNLNHHSVFQNLYFSIQIAKLFTLMFQNCNGTVFLLMRNEERNGFLLLVKVYTILNLERKREYVQIILLTESQQKNPHPTLLLTIQDY